MKLAVFASLLASTVAFAPAQPKASSSTMLSASQFANELGVTAPLGLWDPLKLCDGWDQDEFNWYREVEIKHGRVAMLAVVGYLTTLAGVRLPGMESMGSGWSAFDVSNLSPEVRGVLPLTIFCIGMLEFAMRDVAGTSEFPGDYRNGTGPKADPWDKYDEETKWKKRTIELNNGRAAQMGIIGLMVHDFLGNLNEIIYV